MPLWTDVMKPAKLTAFVKALIYQMDENQKTLAQWFPNQEVADVSVRYYIPEDGYVPMADYRAFGAVPTIGDRPGGEWRTLDIVPIGHEIPTNEYELLRMRNSGNQDGIEASIISTAEQVAKAIFERTEHSRGMVLDQAAMVIPELGVNDDFGRDPANVITLAGAAKWDNPAAPRLRPLKEWRKKYLKGGMAPGAILCGLETFDALVEGEEFQTVLIGGANRPATVDEVQSLLRSHGLPPIHLYDRHVFGGAVLPEGGLYFLPAPSAPNSNTGGPLGATLWGQSLTASSPEFGLAPGEMPGVVTGLYKTEKPPIQTSMIADGLSMPYMSNPNLSMKIQVF